MAFKQSTMLLAGVALMALLSLAGCSTSAVEGLEEPNLPAADRGSWDTATSRDLELGGRKLLQNGMAHPGLAGEEQGLLEHVAGRKLLESCASKNSFQQTCTTTSGKDGSCTVCANCKTLSGSTVASCVDSSKGCADITNVNGKLVCNH